MEQGGLVVIAKCFSSLHPWSGSSARHLSFHKYDHLFGIKTGRRPNKSCHRQEEESIINGGDWEEGESEGCGCLRAPCRPVVCPAAAGGWRRVGVLQMLRQLLLRLQAQTPPAIHIIEREVVVDAGTQMEPPSSGSGVGSFLPGRRHLGPCG